MTPSKTLKRLYSLPEAAVYLGRSTWSVRRLIWNGELFQVERVGGCMWIYGTWRNLSRRTRSVKMWLDKVMLDRVITISSNAEDTGHT
jgi:hypothetical protein